MGDTSGDTIEAVRAALAGDGRDPDQVQWADAQTSWHEGTVVCERDGDAVVLRRLGRGEDGDRSERFASEDEAAAHLRRMLLDVPVRHTTEEEQQEIRERMRRRAEETKARLRGEQA